MCPQFKGKVAFFFLTTSLSIAWAQKSTEPIPSYEDTVHYIQERLDGGLEETGRCRFVYHDVGEPAFDVKSLSPHVSWENKHEASINCAGGSQCVQYSHTDKRRDFWMFHTKADTNRDKIEKALLHLLNLCGVRPPKPDLF
jgi:hypothetical protein